MPWSTHLCFECPSSGPSPLCLCNCFLRFERSSHAFPAVSSFSNLQSASLWFSLCIPSLKGHPPQMSLTCVRTISWLNIQTNTFLLISNCHLIPPLEMALIHQSMETALAEVTDCVFTYRLNGFSHCSSSLDLSPSLDIGLPKEKIPLNSLPLWQVQQNVLPSIHTCFFN